MQINKTTFRYMLKSFIFNGTYHLVKIRSAQISAFSVKVQQSYFAVTLDMNRLLHVKIVIKNPGICRFIDRYNLSNDRISVL